MNGILPVWKPAGISSFDVIRQIKHNLLKNLPGKIKIGHAGTLDPFAEGVLLIMLGRATKRFDEIMTWGKTYRAVARLGASSDTLDRTGTINNDYPKPQLTSQEVSSAAAKLVGVIDQIVPQYSAAKYHGKPLYLYARQGIGTPIKSKKVTIYSLSITKVEDTEVELVVSCSAGTYIRQLSYDLFHHLGSESYLESLVREKVGTINKDKCLALTQVSDVNAVMSHLLPDDGEF